MRDCTFENIPMNHGIPADRSQGSKPARVDVLVETWNSYGRGIVEGIWNYQQKHTRWQLHLNVTEGEDHIRAHKGWVGEGIIAQARSVSMVAALKQFKVPIINVSGSTVPGTDLFPRVCCDSEQVVRLAVNHLLDKGFRTVAFCGEPDRKYTLYWTEAYCKVMKASGLPQHIFDYSEGISGKTNHDELQKDRQRWLNELPRPAGIIGWDSKICRALTIACNSAGLRVPEDLAIISLSNDDLIGKLSVPPISGVEIAAERMGWEAAKILDQMLGGAKRAASPKLIAPLGVVTRQSTNILAVSDRAVCKALQFIHAHEGDAIDVRDVLKQVPMARRSLERQFRKLLNRSPAQEIRRVHLEKARRLLLETDLTVPDVAEKSGFKYVEHLIPVFRTYFGVTPLAYRKNARPG